MKSIFKNVFFTKGHNRTLVFDSLKNDIFFVPNSFYEKLNSNNFTFKVEDLSTDEYNFLLENELLIDVDNNNLRNFSDLRGIIDFPFDFKICVIELSEAVSFQLGKLLLNRMLFGQLNVVFSEFSNLKSIDCLIAFIDELEIDCIDLTFETGFTEYEYLFKSISKDNRIYIINNNTNKKIVDDYHSFNNRMFRPNGIKESKITNDLSVYFESIEKNTYYSDKLFIGRNTEIKNSKESDYIYNHLSDLDSLNSIKLLRDEKFIEYWRVTKDKIIVCKDCEFRRFCNDNRPPIKGKKFYYHERECEYNPYISKWSEEDNYVDLQSAGISIEKDDVIIDKDKLNTINEYIWD
ncbi:hypothetical protein [Flavobacterium sp. CS20]|uniref:hypothetical protein n=1 Tax=Flavobacterium sp. CS20 TaxID=2775246 RepID=UPI001B3A4C67|nr:hypothetical protein [Flavobacterium sp. CS20]QTY25996.1 hypothetical protein IGB25_08235 [Flavobacterium sp. CS20]